MSEDENKQQQHGGSPQKPSISTSAHSLIGEGIGEEADGELAVEVPAVSAPVPASRPAPAPPSPASRAQGLVNDTTDINRLSSASLNSAKPPAAGQISGRPPRPSPQVQASLRKVNKAQHAHNPSNGDYSFLSALTDAMDAPDLEIARTRTVSWDRNFAEDSNRAILQPVLESNTPILPSATSRRRLSVTLREIGSANPLESEAENAILRAMEENRQASPGRTANVGNVLPHVTDQAMNAFQPDPAQNHSPDPRTTYATSNASSNPPPSPQPKGHRRDKSNATAFSAGRERTDSLESTLFGLTTVMRMMGTHHVDSDQPIGDVPTNTHRRLPSRDTANLNAIQNQNMPQNNTDTLVHNANILFRRSIERGGAARDLMTETQGRSQRRQNQSRWSILSQSHLSSLDTKKSDGNLEPIDDDESDAGIPVDVELGNANTSNTSNLTLIAQARTKKQRFGAAGTVMAKGVNGTKQVIQKATRDAIEDWGYFSDFIRPKKGTIRMYFRTMMLYMFIPAIAVAAILFYGVGNPIMGRGSASISWFILFLVRQLVTFTMAKGTEMIVIDYLSLQCRWTVRIFGPILTLVIVQSKGFPFMMFAWSIYDLALLSGDSNNKFAQHWLYWQSGIGMFNARNPSGTITSSSANYTILTIGVVVGVVVAIKRLWWGLYLGRRSYVHYGDELAKVIQQMVHLGEVANLAREYEKLGSRLETVGASMHPEIDGDVPMNLDCYDVDDSVDEDSVGAPLSPLQTPTSPSRQEIDAVARSIGNEKVIDEDCKDKFTGSLSHSQKIRMYQLVGRWEEPDTIVSDEKSVSINAILQFRQALALMDHDFPFSLAFGPADTRESCIESSQKIYERLMLRTPNKSVLSFESIAVLAKTREGELDQRKMKDLIRLFRPDREGKLTMIDFVRSCDNVYKSMRMLRASIANAGQIDHAFEVLVNCVFYIILTCVILSSVGLDPLALFLSLSSIILAFAFMIGSASSKYFEGILFILVRRPYDIGDRIGTSDVNTDTSPGGSSTWFVQNVDLFTTTVRYASTNEVATLANGSLAASRIINFKRSPKAIRMVYMKFSVDVPYQKIQVFKKTVENFVKDRPREWLSLLGFRATRVESDLGYVEYIIVLQHREAWQNIGPILNSTADVASYCLEVSKKLEMRYTAPPLPVNLNLNQSAMKQAMETMTLDNMNHVMLSSIPTDVHDVHSVDAMFDPTQPDD